VKTAIDILARELGKSAFDKGCSADERMLVRLFIKDQQSKELETSDNFIDFGAANGWLETPELVKRCVAKKHSPKQTGVGRCLTEVRCELCRYKYLIDSSD
jgi:hypothetical protein